MAQTLEQSGGYKKAKGLVGNVELLRGGKYLVEYDVFKKCGLFWPCF